MARYPDPHARLEQALVALAGGEIVESRETAWASATFSGARHRYVMRVPAGHDISPLMAIEEREFNLPGHILADIVLTERDEHPGDRRIAIDALTVEDA